MRKYDLTISDPTNGKKLLEFGVGSQNPQGPELQFNIQQFSAGQTVNNTITLFNIHPFYFNENQNLYGKRITINAGFEDTPIIKKIGYSGSYGQIIDGYVTNAIPDWKGKDTQIALVVQPYNPVVSSSSLISMHVGELVLPKIKQAFKSLTGDEGLLDLGNIPTTLISKSNYQHIVDSPASLDNLLQDVHGMTLAQKQTGFTLYSADFATPISTRKTITLKEGDFILQPSLIDGTLVEVAITLMMRSDINLYDYVVIPQDIWVGIAALDVVRDADGLIDMFKGKSVFSLFSGTYLVDSIWQLGDVRSPDISAWATTLHGRKV